MPTSPSQNVSLPISASASVSPLKITLNWYTYISAASYTIYRKLKSDTSWSQLTTLSSTFSQYTDSSVALNTYYEYKVQRASGSGTAYGYVASGVNVAEVEYRGKMFLVVDNFFLNSGNPITSELAQLQSDLIGDGWVIIRLDVSRATTPASVRSQIKSIYDAAPANDKPKMVFILGHITPYFSAQISPDGHNYAADPVAISSGSLGFPCDAFFGEMSNTWSTPPSSMPSDVEMGVGRVDFYNLSVFGQTEEVMMKNYLNKLHTFKIKNYTPMTRMIIRDGFAYDSYPYAESSYRSYGPLIGVGTQSGTYSLSNLTDRTQMCPPCFFYGNGPILSEMSDPQGYLWGYISGGGYYDSIESGNGDTLRSSNFVSTACNITFNMMMGSYFGRWDGTGTYSSILRSSLASGKCLTNCWVGQPAWNFHHMGMGDPIGYSAMMSVNNRTTNDTYLPQNTGWLGDGYTTIHLSLMGDPTLRMNYIPPPSNLSVTSVGSVYTFNWTGATGSAGYHIYQVIDGAQSVRVNPSLITLTSFTSSSTSGTNYMVRSVKLESNYSGRYYNLSTGSFGSLTMSSSSFRIKMLLGGSYKSLTGVTQSNNGIMRDDLRSLNLIPLSDPYPALGYTHSGTASVSSIGQYILDIQGNTAPVDWVVVEMRSSSSPSTVLQSIPCIVRRNGEVITTSNNTTITSPFGGTGSYYIGVKHRNHLGIMTSSPITVNSSNPLIDFTNPSTGVYGTSSRMVIGSYSCLWSGNTNFNGVVKYTGSGNDRDPILIKVGSTNPTTVVLSYCGEDVNMDGYAKYTGPNNDRDIILQNIGGSTPNSSILEQLP